MTNCIDPYNFNAVVSELLFFISKRITFLLEQKSYFTSVMYKQLCLVNYNSKYSTMSKLLLLNNKQSTILKKNIYLHLEYYNNLLIF